jgi:hypothetical protein
MATADQQVAAQFNGTDPDTGNTQAWANAKLRMRTTLSNILSKTPFSYQFGRWDQITTTAEQIAWRYIDADGIVWDHKSWQLVQIERFKAGNPTPTPALIAQWRRNADVLRPWPTTDVINGGSYTGALAGEPTQVYPPYPPVTTTS